MSKEDKHSLKKALIHLMLCAYVFGLINPAMPVIKDIFAHTFFKMEHLATVHYENGKYHMHVELQKEAKKNDTKNIPAFSNNESLSSHLKSEDLNFDIYLEKIAEINSPHLDALVDNLIPIPIIPPKPQEINLF